MQRIGGSSAASRRIVWKGSCQQQQMLFLGRSGKRCSSNCSSQYPSRLHHQQVRGKKTLSSSSSSSSSSAKKDKLRSISRTLKAQNEKIHQQNNNNATASSKEYIFGLKPVDVTILPPLYRPPPPPPPKSGLQRLVLPFTIVTFVGTAAYFYFNNQNDAHGYWEAMQTGGVIPGTYDDDDDDDDDDFDDEEEE